MALLPLYADSACLPRQRLHEYSRPRTTAKRSLIGERNTRTPPHTPASVAYKRTRAAPRVLLNRFDCVFNSLSGLGEGVAYALWWVVAAAARSRVPVRETREVQIAGAPFSSPGPGLARGRRETVQKSERAWRRRLHA